MSQTFPHHVAATTLTATHGLKHDHQTRPLLTTLTNLWWSTYRDGEDAWLVEEIRWRRSPGCPKILTLFSQRNETLGNIIHSLSTGRLSRFWMSWMSIEELISSSSGLENKPNYLSFLRDLWHQSGSCDIESWPCDFDLWSGDLESWSCILDLWSHNFWCIWTESWGGSQVCQPRVPSMVVFYYL